MIENSFEGIKYLVKFSVVPKFNADELKIKFLDKVMKNVVNIRALPAVEMLIALPDSYPSN